ncbi:MAG: hypothetical protein LBC87_06255 [Fibromonadaceae bacterium]|jgi:hypothetical protein|nr:hypothetical protein [Fibromonadaceae bacterium]
MKYLLLLACLILCSCSTEEKTPDFYFDEKKFMSEWDIWKNPNIKNYNFTLDMKDYNYIVSRAKKYYGAPYNYKVEIAVKNDTMDSFKYIGKAPHENGAIVEPEYTSISDMYQKIYDEIKNHELEFLNRPQGCTIERRFEIKYNQEFHYITHYQPTFGKISGCSDYTIDFETSLYEVFISDFTILTP